VTYLLDTNIFSETRKRQPAAGVMDWIAATPPERLHVSVLTLGEIEQGSAGIRGRGGHSRRLALSAGRGKRNSGLRTGVLSVTLRVTSAWGRQQHAQPLPVVDG